MLRILSGRHASSVRSSKSVDLNQSQVDIDDAPLIDLATTVDDDDDSRMVLYSDVEEDVRDFELHASRLPEQSHRNRMGSGRRKKRPSQRSTIVVSELKIAPKVTGRSIMSDRHLHDEEAATPIRTIEMRKDTAELDGIIRAFANRRESPKQAKRRGLSRKKRADVYDEDVSSSSYHSGFSSSESSTSSQERMTSLLSGNKTSDMESEQNGKSAFNSRSSAYVDDDDHSSHFDSLFARYGNANDKRDKSGSAGVDNNALPGMAAPVPAIDVDVMSSAGESDACSRQSFSTLVSLTRSLAGASIRKLWPSRKKRAGAGKVTTPQMDHTERTTESTSSTPVGADAATEANVNRAKMAIVTPPRLRSKKGRSSQKSSKSPKVKSTDSLRSKSTVTSSPLATGSMPVDSVRGFDCDTGAFVTESNLAMSSVLDPNAKSLKATVRLTKTFDVTGLQEKSTRRSLASRLEDKNLSGLSSPKVKYIIDPADMRVFLKTGDDNSTPTCRLEKFMDDDVSSLSSTSSLTLSPTSVIYTPTSDALYRGRKAEKSVSVRAKSLMSSSRGQSLNEAADQLGRVAMKSRQTSSPLKQLQHDSLNSPTRSYLYPSTLQVPSRHRSISILLIEPVLKVFEIVSVGIRSGTSAGDVIRSACTAAADETLSQQKYISLCGVSHVITDLDESVAKLVPRTVVGAGAAAATAAAGMRGISKDDILRREMERTLIVAVPEKSNPTECIKIRHMLWKNPKLQVWWQTMQKGRTSNSSVKSLGSR